MGLDMYLYERHYLPSKSTKKGFMKTNQLTIKVPKCFGSEELVKKKLKNVKYIDCEVGYWRKANAIHQYFLDKCTNPNSDEDANGKDLFPSNTDLLELKQICLELLGCYGKKFKDKAEELLPTSSGFFWGGLEYDKWYRADLRNTIKIINKLHLDDPYVTIVYNANW